MQSLLNEPRRPSDIFGMAAEIRDVSYVDRGELDQRILTSAGRDKVIAIRGDSRCGKSWLRQKLLPNAIVVQCRPSHKIEDLYAMALSELGVKIEIESSNGSNGNITLEAQQEIGVSWLSKLGLKQQIVGGINSTEKFQLPSNPKNDLKLFSQIIIASGRRLIFEDFHYISEDERKFLARDLKTLWDYRCFCVVIGIWSQQNYLIYLNGDLTLRLDEFNITWSHGELEEVIDKGCRSLNLSIDAPLKKSIIDNSYSCVGVLQEVILATLDEFGVTKKGQFLQLGDMSKFECAALKCADQMNGLYQNFASTLTAGIRRRKNSTAIYAYTLAAIFEQDDQVLMQGISVDKIFEIAHGRQNRIILSNLKSVLGRFEKIQSLSGNSNPILVYDGQNEFVILADKQLLFYRKFSTISWPWQKIIDESNTDQVIAGFESDDEE